MNLPSLVCPTALLGLSVTSACGSLSGSTDAPSTLATIHGTIESRSTAPGGSLATALVWYTDGPTSTVYQSSTSVPVKGTFPASFTIDITTPPPASLQTDLGVASGDPSVKGLHFAGAYLVAYDDLNHNGKLDLVSAGAPAYVDQAEGFTSDYFIAYFEREIPDPAFTTGAVPLGVDGSRPKAGYNIGVMRHNDCFQADGGATCTNGYEWRPIDSPITLAIGTSTDAATEARLRATMCAVVPNASLVLSSPCAAGDTTCSTVESVSAFSGPLPSPDDARVACLDPNRFQYFDGCTTPTTAICEGAATVCSKELIVTLNPSGSAPIAPPSDWPCIVKASP